MGNLRYEHLEGLRLTKTIMLDINNKMHSAQNLKRIQFFKKFDIMIIIYYKTIVINGISSRNMRQVMQEYFVHAPLHHYSSNRRLYI